jgi:hypothetical protein
MSEAVFWAVVIVALVAGCEVLRAELREWSARRRTIREGRTLTAKYGIPWR